VAGAAGRKGAMVSRTKKNVLLTGRPGVGKTTIVQGVLDELDVDAGGFYTREIREHGQRVGFAIRDLRGREGVLAHVELESPYRVGKYGVNRSDLEEIGVRALNDAIAASRLVVMDEIGRMELCSEAFQSAVMRALDAPVPVFGTIQGRPNPFLDAVRAREDLELFRVTEKNRNRVRDEVMSRLVALLAG